MAEDSNAQDNVVEDAPAGQKNWSALLAGEPCKSIQEYPLYSDSRFTGEIRDGLGPYTLLNAIRRDIGPFGPSEPALVLRASNHLELEIQLAEKTQQDAYFGGSVQDEIPALLALCLGVRLKSGGTSRLYFNCDDAVGRPLGQQPATIPQLVYSGSAAVLPGFARQIALSPDLLKTYQQLAPADAVALVRAARLYQDAVWIAETEPALSWLMLVAAIETVAQRWSKEELTSVEILRKGKPDLADLCRDAGGEKHLAAVANLVAPGVRSTAKFLGFLEEHHPTPRPRRPTEGAQVEWAWSNKGLKGALQIIYKYRSKALHEGIPFPAPLGSPPMLLDGVPEERPLGSAAQSLGGTWLRKDLPMHLHTFEYIARNSILKWWRETDERKPSLPAANLVRRTQL